MIVADFHTEPGTLGREEPLHGGPEDGHVAVVPLAQLEIVVPYNGQRCRYVRDRLPTGGRPTRFHYVEQL